MTFLRNIVWFVLGGWLLFIFYTLAAIVFFPMFIPLWRIAIYSAWPMGRSVISQSQWTKYKEITGKSIELGKSESLIRELSSIRNVLWLLTFGLLLALSYLFGALAYLALFLLIITIPIRGLSSVFNVLWLLTFGWFLALIHLFVALANLALFFLIITIPNIVGHCKLMGVALMPFNKKIVPTTFAKEVTDAIASSKLGI